MSRREENCKEANLLNLASSSARTSGVSGTVEPSLLQSTLVHLESTLSGAPLENINSIWFRLQRTLIILRSRENSKTETCNRTTSQAHILENINNYVSHAFSR